MDVYSLLSLWTVASKNSQFHSVGGGWEVCVCVCVCVGWGGGGVTKQFRTIFPVINVQEKYS